MKLLSRGEELILLAIGKLGENAYCVEILQQAEDDTGKTWTLGGVYALLNRLEKNGLIDSKLGPPSPERGGKRKRYYTITAGGIEALREIKNIENSMWYGSEDIIFGE